MDLKKYLDERRESRILSDMGASLSTLVDQGRVQILQGEDLVENTDSIPLGVMGEVSAERVAVNNRFQMEQKLAQEQVYAIAEFASDSKKSNANVAEQLVQLNKTLREVSASLGLIHQDVKPKTGPVVNSKEDTYRKASPQDVKPHEAKTKLQRAAVAAGGGGLLGMGLDLLEDFWPNKKKKKKTVGEPVPQTPKGKGGWFSKIASKIGFGAAGASGAAAEGGGGLFKSLGGALKGSALIAGLMELPNLYNTLSTEDPSVDKTKEVAKTGGRIAGVTAGAAAGGAAGAALGSVVPVVGTAVGGLAGSIIGGIAGSGAGEWIADKGTNAVRFAGAKLTGAGEWLGGAAYDAKEYVSDKATKGMQWAKDNLDPSTILKTIGAGMFPMLSMGKSVADAVSSAFKIDIIPSFSSVASSFMSSVTLMGDNLKAFFTDFGKKASEFLEDTKNKVAFGAATAVGYANKAANKARDFVAGAVNGGATALGFKSPMKTSIEKDILASGNALGAVSKKWESGGRGVETISTGKGDFGGVSYGTYQLASNNGSMSTFLKSQEGQKYAQQFQGLTPGTEAFNNAYKNVVSSDKSGFEAAQQAYISRTHYAPMAQKLKDNTGLDVSQRGRALQEQVFSTSVQYGANSKVLQKALAGLTPEQIKGMSDEQLTQKITDYKKATVGQYFSKSSAEVQASVANRFGNEQKDYNAILADAKLNNATDRNKSYQNFIASRGGDTAENKKAWLATQQSTQVAKAAPSPTNGTVSPNSTTAKPQDVTAVGTLAVNPKATSTSTVASAEPVRVSKSELTPDIKTVQIANASDIKSEPQEGQTQNTLVPSSSTINGAQPTLASIPMVIDDFGLQLLNLGLL